VLEIGQIALGSHHPSNLHPSRPHFTPTCARQVTDLLEHRVLNVGIGHELFHKMVRELAVLGFLSFSSSVLLQFVVLSEQTVQLFEYAHTVMCAPAAIKPPRRHGRSHTAAPCILNGLTCDSARPAPRFLIACFFCVEVAHITLKLHAVQRFFHTSDQQQEEALAESYPSLFLFRKLAVLESIPIIAYVRAQTSSIGRAATLKVLRFQFMSANHLLSTRNFSVSRRLDLWVVLQPGSPHTTWRAVPLSGRTQGRHTHVRRVGHVPLSLVGALHRRDDRDTDGRVGGTPCEIESKTAQQHSALRPGPLSLGFEPRNGRCSRSASARRRGSTLRSTCPSTCG
jgi:hypothetical protein